MAWELVDHVCRICFGRLLERDGVVKCSNCGAELRGHVRDLCCCGLKLKTGKNAGIKCVRNKNISPEFPGEIVAEQVV